MNAKSLLISAIFLAPVLASAQEAQPQKHFSLGLASYATAVGYSDNGRDDTEGFGGPALIAIGAINDHVAFRLTYAAQENTDDSGHNIDALEGAMLLGTGLATQGFRAYGALGLFDETHEYTAYRRTAEQDYSGYTLGGGLGYNWRFVTLDVWLNLRDASDYEDNYYTRRPDDVVAMSGGLGLFARF
ncbi:outer membrane beta-barrel protein [Gilvimarinus polysaccharolyticus]|uniref:outer membrane beta-barrel protein n=1 Tax=Gilvimarinus polysaccharolyticus TaxID=863921 RepID=UPI0018DDFB11|nr:outer membrane beta-barrel protein [Gilvimarinus polysaccharolyticus]